MNEQMIEYYSKVYDESPEFHEYVTKDEYVNEMITKQQYGVDTLPERGVIGEALHGVWSGATDQFPRGFFGALRGGNVETPDQRSWWNQFLTERIEENEADLANDLPSLEEAQGSRLHQAIRGGMQSIPFSLGVKAAGAGAGALTAGAMGLTSGPGALAAAAVGAGVGSYAAMYNSAKDQFMGELYDICVNQEGATPEEWDQIQQYAEGIAQKFGHAEAGPEAIAGVIETVLAGFPLGKISKAAKAVSATTGKPSIISSVLEGAKTGGKFMGSVALSEIPTETYTEKVQQDEWAKLKGEDPITWTQALKNVGPETVVQSLAMGGGIATGRHIARKLTKGQSVDLLGETDTGAPKTPAGQQTPNTGVSMGALPETIIRPGTQPFTPHEMQETSILGGPEPTVIPVLPEALRQQLAMGQMPQTPGPRSAPGMPTNGPINPQGTPPSPQFPVVPQDRHLCLRLKNSSLNHPCLDQDHKARLRRRLHRQPGPYSRLPHRVVTSWTTWLQFSKPCRTRKSTTRSSTRL